MIQLIAGHDFDQLAGPVALSVLVDFLIQPLF